MSTYVKRKCSNCDYTFENWTKDYKSIGEPYSKCKQSGSYIILDHVSEWDLLTRGNKIWWILNPYSYLMYGLSGILLVYFLENKLVIIQTASISLYILAFILGACLRGYFLFSTIRNSNKRMLDSEYRMFLRKLGALFPRIYYSSSKLNHCYMDGDPNTYGALFHKNGARKFEGHLKNGLPNGEGQEWYDTGNLKYEGNFLNGVYHGFGISYDEHSKRLYQAEYNHGTIVKKQLC